MIFAHIDALSAHPLMFTINFTSIPGDSDSYIVHCDYAGRTYSSDQTSIAPVKSLEKLLALPRRVSYIDETDSIEVVYTIEAIDFDVKFTLQEKTRTLEELRAEVRHLKQENARLRTAEDDAVYYEFNISVGNGSHYLAKKNSKGEQLGAPISTINGDAFWPGPLGAITNKHIIEAIERIVDVYGPLRLLSGKMEHQVAQYIAPSIRLMFTFREGRPLLFTDRETVNKIHIPIYRHWAPNGFQIETLFFQ